MTCRECGSVITLGAPPLPQVPSCVYIGSERSERIKLLPLPPREVVYERHGVYHQWSQGGCDDCEFARGALGGYGSPMDCGFSLPGEVQPYSIRSFLIQLSLRSDFPCRYFVRAVTKDDYGNIIWDDGCMESCSGCDYSPYYHPCNVASGWMHGEGECPGWVFISSLCQTDIERLFLSQYLRLNHDREFPMPIPQAYLEIEERIRVDFVIFVPMTRFKWKWLVIEVDSKTYHQDRERDKHREAILGKLGFEVIRLTTASRMLDQVRAVYRRVADLQALSTASVHGGQER